MLWMYIYYIYIYIEHILAPYLFIFLEAVRDDSMCYALN